MPFNREDTSQLLDELPEALLIVALQGEILFVNQALESLTGYSANELTGCDVSKLLPTPERRRVQVIEWFSRWASAPDPDQLRYLNLELVTRHGDVRLVSVRVSRHETQDEARFIVVLRDVTSQHETMAALRHAQLVTNRILAIGEDAVLSVNEQQNITYWNLRAEELFGYTAAEIIGQPLSSLLPAEIASEHLVLARQFAMGEVPSKMMGERGEIYGVHKDGHKLSLEASITKTTIDGQVILSAQIRDIAGRKQREQALAESEARFRALFEHAMEAMALLAPDGQVLEINAAARAMLPAYTPGRSVWQLDWWHDTADPNRAAADVTAEAAIDEARRNLKQAVERCAQGEVIRTRTTLGAGRELDFSLIPVPGADDELRYIIAEGRDITVHH